MALDVQRQAQDSGQITLPCSPSWKSVFTHLASATPPDLSLDTPPATSAFPDSKCISPVRTDSASPPGLPDVAFSSDESDSDSAETAFESALSNVSCGEFDEAVVVVPNNPLPPFAPTPGDDASTVSEQQSFQDSVQSSLSPAITVQPLAIDTDFTSSPTAAVTTSESGTTLSQSTSTSPTVPPGLPSQVPTSLPHDGPSQLSPTPQDVPVHQTRSRPLRAKIMSGLPFRRFSTSAQVEQCGDCSDSTASSIFKPILKTLSDSSASSMTTLSALAIKSRDAVLRRASTISATTAVLPMANATTNPDAVAAAAAATIVSAGGAEMAKETAATASSGLADPVPFPIPHRALSAPVHGGAHSAWVPRTPSRLSVAISSPVPRPARALSTPASVPQLRLHTPVCETPAPRMSPANKSPRTLSTPASVPRLQLHTPVYDMPVQRRLSAAISSPSHRLSVRTVSSPTEALTKRTSVGGSPGSLTATPLSSPRPLSMTSNRMSFHMDIVPQWDSMPTSGANGLPSLDEVRNFLYPTRSQIFPSTPIGARDSVAVQQVTGCREQNAENVEPPRARNVLRKAKSEASMLSRKKLKALVLRVVNGDK